MTRYFEGIGTTRKQQESTFRLIDTVEEGSKKYHELWGIYRPYGVRQYEIRTIKILEDTRVEWTERTFEDLETALEVFNMISTTCLKKRLKGAL